MKTSSVARRLRKSGEPGSAISPAETVVCGKCGQRFAIHGDPVLHTTELAEKQVAWVQDQLVWDHIQERRHQGSIELPDLK